MPKLALIQMSCGDDPEQNLSKAIRYIDEAADRGAQIVALQEIFNTIYFPNRERDPKYFNLAETIPGPTIDCLITKSKERQVLLLAPIYEKEIPGVYYNSALIIEASGEIVGKYRKMHIPHSNHLIEKFYFKPGNLGFPVFNTRYGKIGILICYDRHFPEGARILGLGGAELILIPVASPRPQARDVFVKELMAMAIANQCFVAAINRVGVEVKDEFFGSSLICDPRGEVVAKAGMHNEEVLIADIDLSMVTTVRHSWQFYRDRRPESYGALIQ
jgi:N-carbamoylputrescine amidase